MTLDPPLALLLAVAGGLLQYLVRQFDKMPDWAYHSFAILIGFGLYVTVTPGWEQGPWRDVLVRTVVWLAERVPTIWGGTFVVSNAAKAVAAGNNRASSLLVPVSNSK
jgi:hypothetical protein